MDLEQIKEILYTNLQKHSSLTLKNLSKKVDQPRKKVAFVLATNDCFEKIIRCPSNSTNKRPIWRLKKLTTSPVAEEYMQE